ncbi:MAG TPA: aspartate ammonia-lyase [Acidobacteriota bacterium]|nr:aspartate ammonia-lyase [Acidobacteriota bacterium]
MRIEKDSLGELEVPDDAYYGVQTARAIRNFPISGLRAHPEWIRAVALIKMAAAKANHALGYLERDKANAIIEASAAVSDGKFNDQIVVDVFQAGAGTSFHMNVNEVIANLGCEHLGSVKGDYKKLSPNDHVNMGQSTNDVIPTSIRLSALALVPGLLSELNELGNAFRDRAKAFDGILKSGRTHLQDAVPVRLGQEFGGYAAAVQKQTGRVAEASRSLQDLGIGGSAAGTGVNTHPEYTGLVVRFLSELTGLPLRPATNLFEAMQSMAPFTELSGALRNLCLELIRIANDLRLLASGPNTGLHEIDLPAVQPGSSIMPGKVNPVMAEMLNMVCFHVIGNDTCVAVAAQAGQLELNVMMPVIAYNLLQSLKILTSAVAVFREKCVAGIEANSEACNLYADRTLALATVLNPYIGYLNAAEVAKESLRTGKSIKQIVKERKLLSDEQFAQVFDPAHLTEPRKIK